VRQAEHQWGAPPDRAGTILVADDDGAVRETLGEVLEMAGYEVRRAEDGNEALRVLADERARLERLVVAARPRPVATPKLRG